MKYINSELGLTITIEPELIKELRKYATKYYPKEFGGLLIGRYSDNKLNLEITDTILPKKFRASSFEFFRETKDLREIIKYYFEQNPSKIYVGEWHTHPNASCLPSKTDLEAIEEIVQHEEVFIDNPVLLIISISKQVFELCFYVYSKKKIYKYEVSNF